MFEHWEPGMAKVLERKNLVNGTNTDENRYEYVVEVQASEFGESFRTEFKDPIGGTSVHFVTPQIGEVAAAEVDWKSQKVKWDLKAPGRMGNDPLAGKHAKDAAMRAALAGESNGAESGGAPTIKIAPNANVEIAPGANIAIDPSANIETPAANAVGGIAAQLASITALHEQGMLNDAQFEQAKNAVIGLANK